MPATVIAERIGWTRSMTVLKDRVRELRPLYLPADPCQRTEYRPGELAQWDLWFPPAKIPLGHAQEATLPVIVGVSGYSRWIIARMIPSREAHDILLGHLACLLDLGGVPRAASMTTRRRWCHRHGGKATLTAPFQRFRGTLGMSVIVCKPGDPEAKGLVERANQLSGDELHARPSVHLTAGLQRATGELVAPSQRSGACDAAVPARRPDRRGPRRDDGAAAGAARPRVASRRNGWAVTIGCGSAPATTRCIPERSAGGSKCAWTSTRSW